MKGRTNSSKRTLTEKAIISLKSNQGADPNLNGKKITVSYGEDSKEYFWEGQPITVEVPSDTEYTVTVEEIENYKNPTAKTQTAVGNNIRKLEFLYETTILNINVTTNKSFSDFNNISITVNSKQLTWTGTQLKTNVPTGENYTITGGDLERYLTPNAITQQAVGDTMNIDLQYKTSELIIEVNSNQLEDLGNITVLVNWNNKVDTLQYTNKESKSIHIKFGETYNITFSDVSGYLKPSLSGTANLDIHNLIGTYQSEFLTVSVSGATGFTITVSEIGSQTEASKLYKIPFNTKYTISASNVKGYNTPATQSFTANQVSRSVTMTYTKIANGVYICDSDGKLTAVGSWNTNNNSKAVGVAVVSNKCSFIIDKTNSNDSIQWGEYGTDVPGLSNITNNTEAKLDYDGNSNTDKIISALGSSEDIAAGWCRSKSINIGGENRKGYLPALGEWQTAYNNRSQVDSALSKIGGTAMPTSYHWSSTERSSNNAWRLRWGNGDVDNYSKRNDGYCRPWYVL